MLIHCALLCSLCCSMPQSIYPYYDGLEGNTGTCEKNILKGTKNGQVVQLSTPAWYMVSVGLWCIQLIVWGHLGWSTLTFFVLCLAGT